MSVVFSQPARWCTEHTKMAVRSCDVDPDRDGSGVLQSCVVSPDGIILSEIHDDAMIMQDQLQEHDVIQLENLISAQESRCLTGLRKSDRERKERRSFSPVHQHGQHGNSTRGRRRKGTPRKLHKEPTERQVTCELCFSPYDTNPLNQGPSAKKSRYRPAWRNRINRDTGKLMLLCNACGLAYDRPMKVSKARPAPSPEDKERYLQRVTEFAASLVTELDDSDAERLACPHFKNEGCGCIQRYIMADNNVDESRKRAVELLALLKKAKELSQKKYYEPEKVVEATEGKGYKKPRNIGLGNGQKRCKEFEEFILINRKTLRDELMLCERAAQRVLMYSNNFLHKKLKTETRSCRVERTKGKYVMGLLKPIPSLIKEKCCTYRCVRVAVLLSELMEEWRKRAASGQREARRVIAEMLTPSGGARPNCYNFIEMVTGCSFSTIGKVNEQMRKSGGSREPPAHGMCQYWKKHPAKKRPRATGQDEEANEGSGDEKVKSDAMEVEVLPTDATLSAEETAEAALSLEPFPPEVSADTQVLVSSSVSDVPEPVMIASSTPAVKQLTSVELVNHREQIIALQKQLAQQQVQLQQQQQLLQQQMLHQVLLDQVNGTSGVHIQTLQSLQQLLNLQQQYQQQQLQQLNQLEEQAGLIPGKGLRTANTQQVLGCAELLQLPSSLTVPQLLSQITEQQQQQVDSGSPQQEPPQPVVVMQSLDSQHHLLQHQLQQQQLVLQTDAESLLGIQNGGTGDMTSQDVIVVTSSASRGPTSGGNMAAEGGGILVGDESNKTSGVESLVQIPVPTSSSVSSIILPTPGSLAGKGGSGNGGGAMLPQVVDLTQLGFNFQSLNGSQSTATLLNTDSSQLLSNLNITLVQPPPTSGGTTVRVGDSASSQTLPTVSLTTPDVVDLTGPGGTGSVLPSDADNLTQLLASSLGYAVLTIEPGMTSVDITDADKATAATNTPMFVDLGVVDNDVIASHGDVVSSNDAITSHCVVSSHVATASHSTVMTSASEAAAAGMKLNLIDVGLKAPSGVTVVGKGVVEDGSDMSTSDVLQLLGQHGIEALLPRPAPR